MRITAALGALAVIGRPRNDVAVPPGSGVAPWHRRPRRAGFQRLDLRLIGKFPVVLGERGTDLAADQPAELDIGQRGGGGGGITGSFAAAQRGGALAGALGREIAPAKRQRGK